MAVTVSVYNHTTLLFAGGVINTSDDYKVMLCTAATFNAANTTLSGIPKTEVLASDGYFTGGTSLQNISVTTVATNDAKFDADDVVWVAGTTDIAASYAILFVSSQTGSPPLLFIDFGGEEVAGPTTQFKIIWNADGIISFTV